MAAAPRTRLRTDRLDGCPAARPRAIVENGINMNGPFQISGLFSAVPCTPAVGRSARAGAMPLQRLQCKHSSGLRERWWSGLERSRALETDCCVAGYCARYSRVLRRFRHWFECVECIATEATPKNKRANFQPVIASSAPASGRSRWMKRAIRFSVHSGRISRDERLHCFSFSVRKLPWVASQLRSSQ
jgi:hypothetical protein